MIPSGPVPEVDLVTIIAVLVICIMMVMILYTAIKENHFKGK